jgi:hypothetical protein
MQAHGTALQAAARFEPAPAPSVGTVVGLGVTDALRIELQPCQIEGLVSELEELAGPLAEAYEHARGRWLEISRLGDRAWPPSVADAEHDLSAAAYVLRALSALRTQAPSTAPTTSVALVGPTELLTTIVVGAAQHAAATLVQMLDESDRPAPDGIERLRRLGAAARAWAETYADCRTVEWFSFDPNWDPVERV